MDDREQLSANFYLDEFLISETAERQGISMVPSPRIVHNLTTLAHTVLQPVRDFCGKPINITSGYRPRELNEAIGGSKTSEHMDGRASDFTIAGLTPHDAFVQVIEADVEFNQLIHEFAKWVHASCPAHGQVAKRQELTVFRVDGKSKYVYGLYTEAEFRKEYD